MSRRSADEVGEAVERARFAVRELTRSRVSSAQNRGAELRAQRLRDIGWDERADQLDEQSARRGAGWEL